MEDAFHDKIIGKKFGKLKALSIAYNSSILDYKKYNCICDCGNGIIVEAADLELGRVTSCGCELREEYILLNCIECKRTIEVPFKKDDLRREEKEFEDEEGKIHTQIFYNLNYMCNSCKNQTSKFIISNGKDSREISALKGFINEKCIVQDDIPTFKRTKRSTFKTAYLNWLGFNNMYGYRLQTKDLNYALQRIYGETYVKNNGIFYLKKIKLLSEL